MRRYLAYILALIVAVVLGVTIAKDPGYAIFHYRQTTVTMPLWLCTLFAIVVFIVLVWILRAFDKTRFAIQKMHYWRENKRLLKAHEKSQKGLVEMMEGRYKIAEQHLRDSLKDQEAPLVNYLSAAQIAHEMGDYARRDGYLLKAKKRQPNSEVAINIAKAQLQLDQGDLSEAEFTLDRLRKLSPRHETVLKLLKELFIKQKRWDKVLALLPTLKRHHVINEEDSETLKLSIYKTLLKNNAGDITTLKKAWNDTPRHFRKNHDLVSSYVEHLIVLREDDLAYDLLIQSIKKEWDIHLVRLFGLVHHSKGNQQFELAEKWLKQHKNDSELLLVLGQLALRLKLWGKARTYLENSLELEPRKITYQLLAELLEHLGEKEAALAKYKEGIKF